MRAEFLLATLILLTQADKHVFICWYFVILCKLECALTTQSKGGTDRIAETKGLSR